MYSMVGRRNDTMRLRMRTGMNGGMDDILESVQTTKRLS